MVLRQTCGFSNLLGMFSEQKDPGIEARQGRWARNKHGNINVLSKSKSPLAVLTNKTWPSSLVSSGTENSGLFDLEFTNQKFFPPILLHTLAFAKLSHPLYGSLHCASLPHLYIKRETSKTSQSMDTISPHGIEISTPSLSFLFPFPFLWCWCCCLHPQKWMREDDMARNPTRVREAPADGRRAGTEARPVDEHHRTERMVRPLLGSPEVLLWLLRQGYLRDRGLWGCPKMCRRRRCAARDASGVHPRQPSGFLRRQPGGWLQSAGFHPSFRGFRRVLQGSEMCLGLEPALPRGSAGSEAGPSDSL